MGIDLFCVSFRFREVGIGVVLCFVSVSRSEHFAHFGFVRFVLRGEHRARFLFRFVPRGFLVLR